MPIPFIIGFDDPFQSNLIRHFEMKMNRNLSYGICVDEYLEIEEYLGDLVFDSPQNVPIHSIHWNLFDYLSKSSMNLRMNNLDKKNVGERFDFIWNSFKRGFPKISNWIKVNHLKRSKNWIRSYVFYNKRFSMFNRRYSMCFSGWFVMLDVLPTFV